MPDAVIVSAARTPIGRAAKGSLVDARPDDLAGFAIKAALDKVPELPPEEIVDVMIGCGFPQEKQGMNLGRRAALLAGLPHTVPGTTVNRFCASSLQTIRMAFHAVRAGEGEAFVAGGVESISQVNGYPKSDEELHMALFGDNAPIARILASSVSGVEPEIMGVGPIEAVRKVLAQAGMTIDDVDVMELNEAFAAQVIPVCREVGVDPFSDKLNPHGGAIALGHPYGMTGARIMNTLLNDLETMDRTIGLETMCVGGGQGMAMLVERLN